MMPLPALPPTPSSSTDIHGKDGTKELQPFQMSFELPPPALASPPTESKSRPQKPEFPVQPSETVKSRRRSSAANKREARGFELPPPPTRSRKIIQMRPRQEEEERGAEKEVEKATSGAKASSGGKTGQPSTEGKGGKKKQSATSSAAGRKIARKTAHSLIERRRRSKMNEEFAVLKGMIPACTGEMHKLAILQASIEYVRYLQDCVEKLKAQHNGDAGDQRSSPSPAQTPIAQATFVPNFQTDLSPQQDVEMTGSTAPSPTHTASTHSSVSPTIHPEDARRGSYSSVSTDPRRHSYTTSATTSPACGPQRGPTILPPIGIALGSPALGPGGADEDREATAALLMLNTDRRGYLGQSRERMEDGPRTGSTRGMSVRDLLSS